MFTSTVSKAVCKGLRVGNTHLRDLYYVTQVTGAGRVHRSVVGNAKCRAGVRNVEFRGQ